MALVFTKDHEEGDVKYHAGNVCPRSVPHSRKRDLVLSGVLRKSTEDDAGEKGGAPAAPIPPLLTTAKFIDTESDIVTGPNEDH